MPDRSDLTVDSEVDFWINLRCTIELLESGHYYIIYGNGGYHYIEESGTERYFRTVRMKSSFLYFKIFMTFFSYFWGSYYSLFYIFYHPIDLYSQFEAV